MNNKLVWHQVHREIGVLGTGTFIFLLLQIAVIILFFSDKLNLCLSSILGGLYILVSFSVLAFFCNAALKKGPSASRYMSLVLTGRFFLTGVFLAASVLGLGLNLIALSIPLLYPKIIFTALAIFDKDGKLLKDHSKQEGAEF